MDISRFNKVCAEFPFLHDVIEVSQGTGGWRNHRAIVKLKVAHMDRDMLARGPVCVTDYGEPVSLLELFTVRDGRVTRIMCVTEHIDSNDGYDSSCGFIEGWDEYMLRDNPPPGDDPQLLQIHQDMQRVAEESDRSEEIRERHFRWRVARALNGDEEYVVRVEFETWDEEMPDPEDRYDTIVRNVFSNIVTVFKRPKSCSLLDLIKSTVEAEGVPTAADVEIQQIEINAGIRDAVDRLEARLE